MPDLLGMAQLIWALMAIDFDGHMKCQCSEVALHGIPVWGAALWRRVWLSFLAWEPPGGGIWLGIGEAEFWIRPGVCGLIPPDGLWLGPPSDLLHNVDPAGI